MTRPDDAALANEYASRLSPRRPEAVLGERRDALMRLQESYRQRAKHMRAEAVDMEEHADKLDHGIAELNDALGKLG